SEGRRVPLAEAAPDVPAPLVAIVERLLRSDPGERFQSAGALLDALAPLADVSRGRRELRELVREHRGRAEKPRAAVRVEPAPAGRSAPAVPPGGSPAARSSVPRARHGEPPSTAAPLAGERGAPPAGAEPPASKRTVRWQTHALGPGAWAAGG